MHAAAVNTAPGPCDVPGNEWPRIHVAPAQPGPPPVGATVVLDLVTTAPPRAARQDIAPALAALARQCGRRGLVEVTVLGPPGAAAGPAPPGLDVKWMRTPGGPVRARNQAARAAAHDVVVFLDASAIAEPTLLAAHVGWHQAVADAVTLGVVATTSRRPCAARIRAHRGASLSPLFGAPPTPLPWPHPDMAATRDLTAPRDDLFLALDGANFAIRKAFFQALGGFAETLDDSRAADAEFAYRAFAAGALLVPVGNAMAWTAPRTAIASRARDAALAQWIPHPRYRAPQTPRIYARPRLVVTLRAGDATGDAVAATVDRLLGGRVRDLAVWVAGAAGAAALLRSRFAADPRVRIAARGTALAAFPASPLHAEVSAGPAVDPDTPARLEAALGSAAAARLPLADGSTASIARSWALHRARRTGRPPAAFATNAATPSVRLDAKRRAWNEARHVRGVRTAARFTAWLLASIPRDRGAAAPRRRPRPGPPRPPGTPRLAAVLGVRPAAAGDRARAVLRAVPGVPETPRDSTDMLLKDHAGVAVPFAGPTLCLDQAPVGLSVPAFDPARWNPVGWVRNVEPRAASLGPPGLLPRGARVRREVHPDDRDALRHSHHVVDVAAYHADAYARAAALARIAATGVPVHAADGAPGLAELLGAELHGLLTLAVRGADIARREWISVRMRRAALRAHSLSSRVRQLCAAAGVADPPPPPLVSVLLPTRRPGLLDWALGNVARQNYPRLELVLVLHGDGFGAALDRADPPFPTKVLRVPGDAPLGSALNIATAHAGGTLLAKMDDDDIYGPNHIADLVLAHEYSGAAVVGKGTETVYLAHHDRTVRYALDNAETYGSWHLSGGTLLVARADLDRVGGWRRTASGEDRALLADIARAGGQIYRTHGTEYVVVRHAGPHTWSLAERSFLTRAQVVRRGLCTSLADIEVGAAELARGPFGPAGARRAGR